MNVYICVFVLPPFLRVGDEMSTCICVRRMCTSVYLSYMSCDIHTHTPAKHSSTNILMNQFLIHLCVTNRLGHGHGYECHSPRMEREVEKRGVWNFQHHLFVVCMCTSVQLFVLPPFLNPPFSSRRSPFCRKLSRLSLLPCRSGFAHTSAFRALSG